MERVAVGCAAVWPADANDMRELGIQGGIAVVALRTLWSHGSGPAIFSILAVGTVCPSRAGWPGRALRTDDPGCAGIVEEALNGLGDERGAGKNVAVGPDVQIRVINRAAVDVPGDRGAHNTILPGAIGGGGKQAFKDVSAVSLCEVADR